MINDYYSYNEIVVAVFLVLAIIGFVAYYAHVIVKFNRRMKEINSLNGRLTSLLNREADLNEKLLYCHLDGRKNEIRNELKLIDCEWNETVRKLKEIVSEDL